MPCDAQYMVPLACANASLPSQLCFEAVEMQNCKGGQGIQVTVHWPSCIEMLTLFAIKFPILLIVHASTCGYCVAVF